MSSLASLFLAGLPPSGTTLRPEEVEARLQAVWQEARARWPRLSLTAEAFVRHWAEKAALLPSPHQGWSELQAVDLYLALACAQQDPAALQHLRSELMPKMVSTLRHVDASDVFVRDRTEELFERVLIPEPGKGPRIAAFGGQGPLEHWLRASALRLALNARRAQKRMPEVPDEEGLLDVAGPTWDPSVELLRRRYGPELSAALKRALRRLGAQERNLLELHFVKGLSLNQVGAMYQVNKSTVSRWLGKARESLLADARTDLAGKLALPPADLESLWTALGPQLDLSLSGALRSKD